MGRSRLWCWELLPIFWASVIWTKPMDPSELSISPPCSGIRIPFLQGTASGHPSAVGWGVDPRRDPLSHPTVDGCAGSVPLRDGMSASDPSSSTIDVMMSSSEICRVDSKHHTTIIWSMVEQFHYFPYFTSYLFIYIFWNFNGFYIFFPADLIQNILLTNIFYHTFLKKINFILFFPYFSIFS